MAILRIGTRKSLLALWQANDVKKKLIQHNSGLDIELVEIVSQGDKTLDIPLAQVGGKGLFLKELEQALTDDMVDIAVHSMKDVPVTLPPNLMIAVICARDDPRDAFVSNNYSHLQQMPVGARLGTCSLRRQSQMRAAYPQIDIINLRGNINTRLDRLDQGHYEGLILATAGLKRLHMTQRIRQVLNTNLSLPAVGQGAVGIECRIDDTRTRKLIKPLNDIETATCVWAERAANAALNGGCHVPIAVHATLQGGQLDIRGMVGSIDGKTILRAQCNGAVSEATRLGQQIATDLIKQGAGEILDSIYATN